MWNHFMILLRYSVDIHRISENGAIKMQKIHYIMHYSIKIIRDKMIECFLFCVRFSARDVRKFKEYFFEPRQGENIDWKIYIVM